MISDYIRTYEKYGYLQCCIEADMKFDKDEFIVKYGQEAFIMLKDFLNRENEEIFRDLKRLIMNGNLRSFSYEGNCYMIERSAGSSKILMIDEVTEENSVWQNLTRFEIDIPDFYNILSEAGDIMI